MKYTTLYYVSLLYTYIKGKLTVGYNALIMHCKSL